MSYNKLFLNKHIKLENIVMNMLLSGDNVFFDKLRKQYELSLIADRNFDNVGFFTDFEIKDNDLKVDNYDYTFGDVFGDYSGKESYFGFILYIRNGLIYSLEGYTYLDEWPNSYDNIYLHYINSNGKNTNTRDLDYIISEIEKQKCNQLKKS